MKNQLLMIIALVGVQQNLTATDSPYLINKNCQNYCASADNKTSCMQTCTKPSNYPANYQGCINLCKNTATKTTNWRTCASNCGYFFKAQ